MNHSEKQNISPEKEQGRMNPVFAELRPWGEYQILLDEVKCKVKKLIINPKKRFSLQYHHKRNETWTVIKGKLKITVDKKVPAKP